MRSINLVHPFTGLHSVAKDEYFFSGFLAFFAYLRRKQNNKMNGEGTEEGENETMTKAEGSSWKNNPVYSNTDDFDVPGKDTFNPTYEFCFDRSSPRCEKQRLYEEAFANTSVSECGMTVFSDDSAKDKGDMRHDYEQFDLITSNSLFAEVDGQFELKTALVVSVSEREFGDEEV